MIGLFGPSLLQVGGKDALLSVAKYDAMKIQENITIHLNKEKFKVKITLEK